MKRLVRPRTLAEIVAETLRNAIFRGELKQGYPLRVSELGRSLDVAHGTVREALRLLGDEKLVDVIPHRGAFVTTLSSQRVWEVYSLRELLEPYAVGLAMGRDAYGEPDLQEIEDVLGRLRHADQLGDSFEQLMTDVDFHFAICKPSGHQLLLDTLGNVQSLVTLCVTSFRLYRIEPKSEEPGHRLIFDAIRVHDCALVQDLIRAHLDGAKAELLGAVAMTAGCNA